MEEDASSPTSGVEKLAVRTGLADRRDAVGAVRKIFEIIKAGRICSLQDLSTELHLSRSHLQHLFKRETGLSLGQMLIEHKLLIAAELLRNSKLRIKQIACAVGYEHTSSFVRAFERRFKLPPQTYRGHSS